MSLKKTSSPIEKLLKGPFIDLGEGSPKVFKRAMDDLIAIPVHEFTQERIRPLIDPDLGDVSEGMAIVAHQALRHEAGAVLWPGYSAMLIDDHGRIRGMQHRPNPSPNLADIYGVEERWEIAKAIQERMASSAGGGTSYQGYRVIHHARNGEQPLETLSLGMRHHIGGAILQSATGGELYAGVTGVVARPTFHGWARSVNSDMGSIIDEAYEDFHGVLDDLDANLVAGSLDSTLAARLLNQVPVQGYESRVVQPTLFGRQAVIDIVQRSKDGINVH